MTRAAYVEIAHGTDRTAAVPPAQLEVRRADHQDHARHRVQRLIALPKSHVPGLAHAAIGRGVAVPHDDVGMITGAELARGMFSAAEA